MKLSAKALSMASAITVATFWLICSFLVAISPGSMMQMTGQMVHMDVAEASWSLNWGGFFFGLIVWTALAAIFGWLIAFIYNRLAAE